MGLIGIGGTIIATSIATTGMVTVGDEANAPRLSRAIVMRDNSLLTSSFAARAPLPGAMLLQALGVIQPKKPGRSGRELARQG
jgi:hypothetical protein